MSKVWPAPGDMLVTHDANNPLGNVPLFDSSAKPTAQLCLRAASVPCGELCIVICLCSQADRGSPHMLVIVKGRAGYVYLRHTMRP